MTDTAARPAPGIRTENALADYEYIATVNQMLQSAGRPPMDAVERSDAARYRIKGMRPDTARNKILRRRRNSVS